MPDDPSKEQDQTALELSKLLRDYMRIKGGYEHDEHLYDALEVWIDNQEPG